MYHGTHETPDTLGTFGTLLVCFSPLKALKKAFLDYFFNRNWRKNSAFWTKINLKSPKKEVFDQEISEKKHFFDSLNHKYLYIIQLLLSTAWSITSG